ncbi:EcsC family protein [Dyadobacter luticola]|uniref:EcsC family protein n=1 Tax=Dyadobacter luticola TaxID=1979387 RepID=A0A5R9L3C0_9BACT|nr:EcsC family protein [Dyadobacter luticola]TLV02760.1 EcsC family protein [Dyadobacter luticola]
MQKEMTDNHLEELRQAMLTLENPGIAAKITNFIGMPIQKALDLLPKNWNEKVGDITRTALIKASDAAIFTMKDKPGGKASNVLHKVGVAVSGGVGGFFGFAALAVELPVSTTIMLRSIADIARSQGESIADAETKLACLEVFALGGTSIEDDHSESGYYAVRLSLVTSVSEVVGYVTRTLSDKGSPAFVRFIASIAQRFGLQISEKVAAQAIPAIGAAGGALINTIFINHFQEMARGHFTVRRLERIYGKEAVKTTYESFFKANIQIKK